MYLGGGAMNQDDDDGRWISRPATPDSLSGRSTINERLIRRIDNEFVSFLLGFKDDPECAPELAKFIEQEFSSPTKDRTRRLERALQVPPMKDFIWGKLKRKLRDYYLPPITPPNPLTPDPSFSPQGQDMSPVTLKARSAAWLGIQRKKSRSLAAQRRKAQRPAAERRRAERQAEQERAEFQVIRLLRQRGGLMSDAMLFDGVESILNRLAAIKRAQQALPGHDLDASTGPPPRLVAEIMPESPEITPQVPETSATLRDHELDNLATSPPLPAPKVTHRVPEVLATVQTPKAVLPRGPEPKITDAKSFGQRSARPSQITAGDGDTSDGDVDMDEGMVAISAPARPPREFKPKERTPYERVHPKRPPKEPVEADEADRGVLALKRNGMEWRHDSKYKGSRQPPLGVRLEQVLNFLREEDVDRSINWESELHEVVEYLEWLHSGDPDYQLRQCSLEVQNMFLDAIAKIRIHEEFEKFHYAVTPLNFQKTTLPRGSKRLNWLGCQRDHPIRLASKPKDPKLPIRYSVTRPIKPVNTMFPPGSEDSNLFHQKLWRGEESYWSGGSDAMKKRNNFITENKAYENLAVKNIGWFLTDPSSGKKLMPDGTIILPDDEYSQCIERGARRAGLQQALRSFTAAEHAMTATPWRRLHVPLDHSALESARVEADKNIFWEPFRLDRSEMPSELDTVPYTFWWREHNKVRMSVREKARQQAIKENGKQRGWVELPPSIDCGGAFRWNRLDPDVNNAQLLLQKCELVQKLLGSAQKRSGDRRQLLMDLTLMCQFAADGEFEEGSRGHEFIRFSEQDWEPGQVGMRVKSLSLPDLDLLSKLGARTANREMLEPLKEKGRLFNIFAKRVERVMEGRNPDASFPEETGQLDVEELLALLNRGCDGPVRKTKFTVTDAMCWLPKLNNQGRLIFHEDLACYGYVVPSYQYIYPEDLLLKVIDRGMAKDIGLVYSSWPPTNTEMRQFLYNVSVRLGITLRRLRQAQAQWSQQTPASTRTLLDSMSKCEAIYDKMAETEGTYVLTPHYTVLQAGPSGMPDKLPDDAALKIIRAKIVEESTANLTLLGRGRPSKESVWTRDHNWAWASNRLRGRPAPRFWSLDRWPVAFQSEQTARRIRTDAALNQRVVWDPRAEDSTEGYPVRPKLRRYGEEEKVRFRPGPAYYSVGDTPLQQKVVQERITEMVAQAIGIDTNRSRTWGERLAGFFQASSLDEDMPDEPQLPKIDPSLMPVSWDPQSMPEASRSKTKA